MTARLTLVRDGDTTVAVVLDGLTAGQVESVDPKSVREAWGCPVTLSRDELDVRVVVQPYAADAETLKTAAEYAEDHAQWQADREKWLASVQQPMEDDTTIVVNVPAGISTEALRNSIRQRIEQLQAHG